MKKTISLRIEEELNSFLERLAKENFSTKTSVLIGFIAKEYKRDVEKNQKMPELPIRVSKK